MKNSTRTRAPFVRKFHNYRGEIQLFLLCRLHRTTSGFTATQWKLILALFFILSLLACVVIAFNPTSLEAPERAYHINIGTARQSPHRYAQPLSLKLRRFNCYLDSLSRSGDVKARDSIERHHPGLIDSFNRLKRLDLR